MGEKLIPNLHWFIVAIALLYTYSGYQDYDVQMIQLEGNLGTAQAQLNAAKQEAEKIDLFREDLEVQKKKVADLESQIKELQKKLPSQVVSSDVVDFLNKKAIEIKLKEVFFDEGKEDLRGFYYAKQFSLKSEGTFLQFIYFFNRLFNAERLYNVSSLEISTEPQKKKGRFQIVEVKAIIETYRYNEEYEEAEKSGASVNQPGAGPKT